MPRVITYGDNKVSSQVVRGARASTVDNGLGNLAAGVSTLGKDLEIMEKKRDEAEAEEALVQFEREKNDVFFNPDSGYFNTQGRTAYDGAGSTNETLNKLKEKYSSAFKSANARNLFDSAADAHITRARADIDRHAAKGLDAWELSTIKAQTENSLENASLYYNDPDKMREFQAVGELQVLEAAKREGISPEATAENLQTYRSSFAKNAVLGALTHSSAEAEDTMAKYGERLEGPDKAALEAKIATKKLQEKDKADSAMAVTIATRLVNESDDYQTVIDQISNIKDPELQDKANSEAAFRWTQKQTAAKEARATNFSDADIFVRSGGSVNEWRANNPEAWYDLTPKQKADLESGKNIETDWTTYNDIMSRPNSEIVKVDPDKVAHKLAPTERKKLIDTQRAIRNGSVPDDFQVGRTRTTQTNDAVLKLVGKSKTKWSDKDKQRADNFYALIDSEKDFREKQKGTKLSSQEYTDLLAEMARKVVIERDWWPDKETDITDIPAGDARVLADALRKRGVPVNAATLTEAYRQANAP